MTSLDALPGDRLDDARADLGSVVALTRELVRIPSRGGIDPYGPVLDCMAGWLADHGLACRRLAGPGDETVALACEVTGSGPGPRYVLDACLDTAPFGDESAWTFSPTSGEIVNGWLHGRGACDSKTGAAIFAHIAARLHQTSGQWTGRVALLFDVDEHTGTFGGARAFFGDQPGRRTDGVLIGYPGPDHVITGGRGVLRAQLRIHGIAGHSGSSSVTPSAIAKACELVTRLHGTELPGPVNPGFPLPARLTVTAISGGQGYSTVPDLGTLNVDIRLTPVLDDNDALALLRSAAADIDTAWPGTQLTDIEVTTCWPPFALPPDEPLRTALMSAARQAGLNPTVKVAYRGLHATDEQVDLASIPPVQAAYHQALLTLLATP